MCAPGADPARGGAPGVPQAQLHRPPQAAAGGRSDQVTSQSISCLTKVSTAAHSSVGVVEINRKFAT